MITRQDYLAKKVTHRQYYSQFVTPQVKNWVENRFGALQLGRAIKKDEFFNSIPLFCWDDLASRRIISNSEIMALLHKADDGISLAGAVCILKEAARQIVEQRG